MEVLIVNIQPLRPTTRRLQQLSGPISARGSLQDCSLIPCNRQRLSIETAALAMRRVDQCVFANETAQAPNSDYQKIS